MGKSKVTLWYNKKPLCQWDHHRVLRVKNATWIRFDEHRRFLVNEGQVTIPDCLLQEAGMLTVWAEHENHDLEAHTFTVYPREKPEEEENQGKAFLHLMGNPLLYQWDTGRTIRAKGAEEIHFEGYENAVPVSNGVALIPDVLLQQPGRLVAYAWDGKRTVGERVYRIRPRGKPAGYAATPTEAKTWNAIEDRLQQVEQKNQDLETQLDDLQDEQEELGHLNDSVEVLTQEQLLLRQLIDSEEVSLLAYGSHEWTASSTAAWQRDSYLSFDNLPVSEGDQLTIGCDHMDSLGYQVCYIYFYDDGGSQIGPNIILDSRVFLDSTGKGTYTIRVEENAASARVVFMMDSNSGSSGNTPIVGRTYYIHNAYVYKGTLTLSSIVEPTASLVSRFDALPSSSLLTPLCSLSLFSKFGVVGDSFASGEVYWQEGNSLVHTDKYSISWGQILARKLGTTCTNYSVGGMTTRSCLTDSHGLPKLLAADPDDIYYLALGINDQYTLGEAYLGSLSDITSYSSSDGYADSFYGNYGRIIESIMDHAPYAKLVLFTLTSTTGLSISYSNAIIELAAHYGIAYIVQLDDPFFSSSIYTSRVGGHPSAIAYSGMAAAFERLLTECIQNNYSYFGDSFMNGSA